jgi:toxin-antitoxin system PIN domain toxin
MNESDLALLDTNVLIYAEQDMSPYHGASKSLRDRALTGEVAACISPQILNEFFGIATNPRRVDQTLTVQEAIDQVKKYYQAKRLIKIYPGTHIIERVISLLETHPVSGADIHDLYLVATMLENNVTRIYTYNTTDFAHIPEIEVLNPEKIEFPKAEE